MNFSIRQDSLHIFPIQVLIYFVAIPSLLACQSTTNIQITDPLETAGNFAPLVPDEVTHTSHTLLVAALSDRTNSFKKAKEQLKALDDSRSSTGTTSSGLMPQVKVLENTLLNDDQAYYHASRKLLKESNLPPHTLTRLQFEVSDDPFTLGQSRLRDAKRNRFARTFNSLAEPLGRSIISGALAPYRLGRSLLGFALNEHQQKQISLEERQALVHWQRFIAQHPDDPRTSKLSAKVKRLQERSRLSQYHHLRRLAERALERNAPDRAQFYAQTALQILPERKEALAISHRANELLKKRKQEDQESWLPNHNSFREALLQRQLATAALVNTPPLDQVLHEAASSPSASKLEGEIHYLKILSSSESGNENQALELLSQAVKKPHQNSMDKHAAAWFNSPRENPIGAFRKSKRAGRSLRLRWLFLGPLASGPRDRDLPRPVEWLVEVPTLLDVTLGFLNRVVRYPFVRTWPSDAVTAKHARYYLKRVPQGESNEALASWLISYEKKRGNHVAGFALAKRYQPQRNNDLLRTKAAQQALESAKKASSPIARFSLFREIAGQYAGTEAATQAGLLARQEHDNYTPQQIQLTREFLYDHPVLTGPKGLALQSELVDGNRRNGELDKKGIIFVGGRIIEVHIENDPEPKRLQQKISPERLSRTVALLEETTLRSALIDPDTLIPTDPHRDFYLERARLGLTGKVDQRALARSEYSYEGLRERFGLVRGRESILPVDLVLRASLGDLSLGAFPRIRPATPTSDAFLYQD